MKMGWDDMHPIYPVTAEDKETIRSELGLKASTIEEDVDAIIDWFQKQPHLVEAGIDRDYVERTLINSRGSMEVAKKRIDGFYKYRFLAPELFQDREKILNDSKDLWTFYIQAAMPKLYKGHRVSVTKFLESDLSNISHEAFIRNTHLLADLRVKYDYFLGDIWLIDLENTNIYFLLKINPILMQKATQFFHNGLGFKIKALHIINPNSILSQAITLMKQFFSPKIMERVQIHQSIEDLHKHLPKAYLPKDYGGEERSLMEFKNMYEKELRSTKTKEYLIKAMKIASNESKRIYECYDQEYITGSFRKLDLD